MELDSGKPGKGDQSQTKKKGTEEQFKQRGGVIDIEHYTDMVLKLLQNGTKWRPSWCMLSFCLSFCFVFVKLLDSGYLCVSSYHQPYWCRHFSEIASTTSQRSISHLVVYIYGRHGYRLPVFQKHTYIYNVHLNHTLSTLNPTNHTSAGREKSKQNPYYTNHTLV